MRTDTRVPDALHREVVQRRSGTARKYSVRNGPGSAAHRCALRGARDTKMS
jgi:hypothetical protein